jgi:hypothetical protein
MAFQENGRSRVGDDASGFRIDDAFRCETRAGDGFGRLLDQSPRQRLQRVPECRDVVRSRVLASGDHTAVAVHQPRLDLGTAKIESKGHASLVSALDFEDAARIVD